MRIGLNLLFMIPGVVGGTETYARGLIRGFSQLHPEYEFVLFLNRESAALGLGDEPGFKSVVCPVNAVRRSERFFFEHVHLRRYVGTHGIDLLHSLGYTSPVFLACPTVVTVHDLNFRAFGSMMPIARRLMLSIAVKQSVLRSSKVIAVSEFSRQEILSAYRVPQDKVVVTHEAVDIPSAPEAVRQDGGAPKLLAMQQPYIVAFSSTYPNKNLPRLVEAFGEAKKRGGLAQKLVLIGHPFTAGEWSQGVQALVESGDVLWAGYMGRNQVFEILRKADFMVFPSFYEGFGLPVLEAMAVGVPVVCSRAASLPEVAGTAAVYFDPFSVPDMAEKIVLVANSASRRDDLRSKGYENVKRFSWKKTAAETAAVYDGLLHSSRT